MENLTTATRTSQTEALAAAMRKPAFRCAAFDTHCHAARRFASRDNGRVVEQAHFVNLASCAWAHRSRPRRALSPITPHIRPDIREAYEGLRSAELIRDSCGNRRPAQGCKNGDSLFRLFGELQSGLENGSSGRPRPTYLDFFRSAILVHCRKYEEVW